MENIIITFTSGQISPAIRQTAVKILGSVSKIREVLNLLILKAVGRILYHLKNLQDLAAHLEAGELKNAVLRVVRMTLLVSFIRPVCQSTGMIGDLIRQQSVTSWSRALSGAASQ